MKLNISRLIFSCTLLFGVVNFSNAQNNMEKEDFKINLGESRGGIERFVVSTLLQTVNDSNKKAGFGAQYNATPDGGTQITIAIISASGFNGTSQGATLSFTDSTSISVGNDKIASPQDGSSNSQYTATIEVPSSKTGTISSFEITGIGKVDIATRLSDAEEDKDSGGPFLTKYTLLKQISECLN